MLPKDTNAHGDIFGGVLLSIMDLAAVPEGLEGSCATVGVNNIRFLKPVYPGDNVSAYAEPIKFGTTSITVKVDCWVNDEKVCEGEFTYVALDMNKKPRPHGIK